MPNPDPSPENRFKEGARGNPGGRPSLTPALREARKVTLIEFAEAFQKQLHMTKDEIQELVLSPYTPLYQLGIAQVVIQWVKTGNSWNMAPFMDRFFGKAPIKHEDEDSASSPRLDSLPREDLEKLEEILRKAMPETPKT